MPQAQDAVDEFYTNLRTLVDDMITTGWKTEGVWTKWKKQADKEMEQFEKMQIEFAKLQDWKSGAQRVIWLIATAAGGMWVKHFMDLMMK